jgi:hypothetical protein
MDKRSLASPDSSEDDTIDITKTQGKGKKKGKAAATKGGAEEEEGPTKPKKKQEITGKKGKVTTPVHSEEEEETTKPAANKKKKVAKKQNEEEPDVDEGGVSEYEDEDAGGVSEADEEETKSKAKGKKQSTKKTGKSKQNRYEALRVMSQGLIEADKGERQNFRKRQEILRAYEVPMPDGSPPTNVRIKYGKCYIDKDDEMQELTGCEVGLVRGMDSIGAFVDVFKAEGWDAQMSGLCTIHVTDEVWLIMRNMTRDEQNAWLRLPTTLLKYVHYIIDGAHRVEIGFAEFGPEATGCFGLVHPSIPFELREKLAISSNTMSEILNKTTLRDKLLFMAKQLQYKRTIPQICHMLDGAWGDVGAMSLLRQVVTRLDRTCWDALNLDYSSVGNKKKTEPMFGQTVMLLPVFKTLPAGVRGSIMQDMVTKTVDGTNYAGCSNSSQKPKGREQALWIASIKGMCLAELKLHTKSKLQIVKTQKAVDNEDLLKRFTADDIHHVIAKEIGIGDSKDWSAPMWQQKKVTVATAPKLLTAIAHKILGEPMFKTVIEVITEPEEKGEKDEKEDEDEPEEFREYPVEAIQGPHFMQGDSTQPSIWTRVKECIADIAQANDVGRVMLVFSPPWGVLSDKTKEGMEDAEITIGQIHEVTHGE